MLAPHRLSGAAKRARYFALTWALLFTTLNIQANEVGFWPLDDGTGTVVDDISSNGLDGTIEGTASPSWSGSGAINGSLSLDGVDDLVVVQDNGTSPLDLVTGLTLSIWINPNSLSGNRSLISKDGAYELDLSHAGTGSYSVRLRNVRRGKGETTLVTGAWQHVAVTWDGSIVRYYHQGQPDGLASFAGALTPNTNDVGLGGRPTSYAGGSPQFVLDGSIDDARIYDRALSAAEISAVYQNQPLPSLPPDNDPAVRSNGSPTGTLPFDTTEVDLQLLTDEAAECRFATIPGVAWSSMVDTFEITGGSFHSESLSGLQNGTAYVYYVRCRDTAGNENPDDFLISFDVEATAPADFDPPVLSSPSPIGTLSPGTSQVTLSVETDEDAECRYSETPGTDFTSMVDVFQVTGGTAHSSLVTGLSDATNRIFYLRCRDLASNANPEDFHVGFWVAEPPPGSGFHPTDLSAVDFFVESRQGLQVATCNTDTCLNSGDNVPLALQYCDTDLFPNGCVRRWEEQSAYSPTVPFEPPEWTAGRDHGQDDIDKPGLIFDCLNGRPCLRGGEGIEQPRSLEIEPNQHIGPTSGPFSIYVLAKPVHQSSNFYYMGFAGSELLHAVDDDSLRLRIGFGSQIQLTGPDAVSLGSWHLIEVHRDIDNTVKTLVDGYDLTLGTPTAAGNFYYRFLFSVSRDKGFYGDLAAALVATGGLSVTEQTDVRQYFADVYGLTVGDGNPPAPGGGVPTDGLIGEWTFEDSIGDCVTDNGIVAGIDGVLGPACSADSPVVDAAGAVGAALAFDGSNDEVSVTGDTALDLLTEISISAWVKTSVAGGFRSIVDKRDGVADGFDLYVAPGGKPFLRINDKALLGFADLADGQWHHVVGLYDGDNMWLYVDGLLDSGRVAGSQTLDTSAPLQIGRSYAGSFSVLDGSVDQIRFYDRALNGAEITALFGEE